MDKQLESLTKAALDFRNRRNWSRFHTGKDLAICLSVEANELLEQFLWKKDNEINIKMVRDELGDVLYVILLLADKYSIDLELAFLDKLDQNEQKYPVDQFRDSNKKYDD